MISYIFTALLRGLIIVLYIGERDSDRDTG